MAFDMDYFLKINNAYGTTSQKDIKLYNLKSQVNDRFADTIDCYKVKVNNVDKDLLIIRTLKQDEKTIKSRPNEDFSMGDYVVFDNKTWLIISKDECDQVYTTGTMKLTNYIIKFQSPTGTIISRPCITSNKSFSNDEGKQITLGSNEKSILLPKTADTLLLKVGDRLYVDTRYKTPYKIIGDIDTTTYNYGSKGLISLVVEQDLSENTSEHPDNPELGICNYREPVIEPEIPEDESYMTIVSSGDLIIGSLSLRTFTPILRNSLGVEQTFTAVWTFNYHGMEQSQFTISYVGNQCKVKVSENFSYLGNVFTLTCATSDGLYSVSYDVIISI